MISGPGPILVTAIILDSPLILGLLLLFGPPLIRKKKKLEEERAQREAEIREFQRRHYREMRDAAERNRRALMGEINDAGAGPAAASAAGPGRAANGSNAEAGAAEGAGRSASQAEAAGSPAARSAPQDASGEGAAGEI